jgi:hypothetical protein
MSGGSERPTFSGNHAYFAISVARALSPKSRSSVTSRVNASLGEAPFGSMITPIPVAVSFAL